MISHLRPEHQAIIERLQPYKRGGQRKANRLYRLAEINNADKHRLLQVVALAPMTRTWSYWDSEAATESIKWSSARVLQDGAKFAEASAGVHVSPKVTPLVAFWKGCPAVENRPVVITLTRIADHVSEIVEGFGPEFAR